MGPTEQVSPEDRDRIQSPKRCVFKNKQDGVLDQDKTLIMSKNTILVLIYHHHKLLDFIFYPEVGNIVTDILNYMASQPRRLWF
jgi:hypothetical protein